MTDYTSECQNSLTQQQAFFTWHQPHQPTKKTLESGSCVLVSTSGKSTLVSCTNHVTQIDIKVIFFAYAPIVRVTHK